MNPADSTDRSLLEPFVESLNGPNALQAAMILAHIGNVDDAWLHLPPEVKKKALFDAGFHILFELAQKKPLTVCDFARAEELLQEGFDVVRKRHIRGQEAHLLRLSGEIGLAASTPNLSLIKQQLTDAIHISEELRMRLNLLRCQELLARTGIPD